MSGSIWLIGFRGAGKSTLGSKLAEALNLDFLDLDQEWELRSGVTILEFTAQNGIEKFRREEEKLLNETSLLLDQGRTIIVATGGGFVDWAPSRAILERSALPKVFLDPPAEVLWQRLAEHPDRRKIGNLTSPAAMEALLEMRRPFYEKIASIRWKDQDINVCLTASKSLWGSQK